MVPQTKRCRAFSWWKILIDLVKALKTVKKNKQKVLLCLDIEFVAYNNAYTINTVFLHQVLASPVIVNENVSYPAGIINVCPLWGHTLRLLSVWLMFVPQNNVCSALFHEFFPHLVQLSSSVELPQLHISISKCQTFMQVPVHLILTCLWLLFQLIL